MAKNPTIKQLYQSFKSMKSLSPKSNNPAEAKNQFSTSIGQSLSSSFSRKSQATASFRYPNSMVLQKTGCDEVRSKFKKMKNKKSTDHDGIRNKFLKLCSPIIQPYLVHAVNKAIETKCFPKNLKEAKVFVLSKEGDTSSPDNYRPISLLSAMSKVFEKNFYKRNTKFFSQTKLFADNQFGFRNQYSCLHATAQTSQFLNEWYDLRSEGYASFIDIKKAFDTIDLSVLLSKLESCSVRAPVLHLREDYLTDRF